MKHTHRIIPGYQGGEYSENNVVLLTPVQHAMWHFAEWQRKGHWQDRVAWRGLAGLIDSDEAKLEAIRNAWKCRKTTKHTEAVSLYWVITSPDGTIYEIRNLRAFCREYSLNQSAMCQVALGRKAAHKGWICRKKK